MTRSLTLLAAAILLGGCSFGLTPAGSTKSDLDRDGVPAPTDCDDDDPAISPEAVEVCDGVDNDCDGTADIDATDGRSAWADADLDGYGDPDAPIVACDFGDGVVADHTDCEDADPDINPGIAEICNDRDDNCNDEVDTDSRDWGTWFVDGDADGYGATDTRADGCVGAGLSRYSGDCDDADSRWHPGAEETDCAGTEDYNCDGSVGRVDADADGFAACEECDDGREAVFPGARELCDGLDNDCDGGLDTNAADAATWYADGDGDGYGLADTATLSCEAPAGYAPLDGDCDDTSAAWNPGATEADCTDPNDYNCDGSVGGDDKDGDGHAACEDCNDDDPAVSPGGAEACNGLDDDCDGAVDEPGSAGEITWSLDADGDGYGSSEAETSACDAPGGYVDNDDDCDDGADDVNPAAAERCNGFDDDCDGVTDPDTASGATTVYRDADRDGYGDPAVTSTGCEALTGWTEDDQDCDDGDAGVYPGAPELCNGADDDCDGTIDPNTSADASVYYQDSDRDGYGDPAATRDACTAPSGYVSASTDCDDSDGDVYPGAPEYCNGADDDCDGTADESGLDAPWWYADSDGDGYGGSTSSITACTAPAGYEATSEDCDDRDSGVHPGAPERCNAVDDDCDGAVDPADAVDASDWYADTDGDSYGDPAAGQSACEAPVGYVGSAADCDDGDSATWPGATETCDGADDDCDGVIDDNVAVTTWYPDGDGDGDGDEGAIPADTVSSCAQPAGYVATHTDCDDDDASVHPAASEACNSVDDDCDGVVDDNASEGTWYRDLDGDTYGDAAVASSGCFQPSGYVDDASDCDDGNAAISPSATESCNSVDDDCNGSIDDGAGSSTWYADTDGDGYGDSGVASMGCTAPGGYVGTSGDCNDGNANIWPGATETCNSMDDDCDGSVDDNAVGSTSWADADGDGYGDPAVSYSGCSTPTGYVGNDDDCDDTSSAASPVGTEACDGLDNDCDGTTDDTVVYQDLDGDGFGSDAITTDGCPAPADYVDLGGDCDDADAGLHPYAYDDLDDLLDNDCDGNADGADTDLVYFANFTDDSYYDLALTTFEFPSCGSPVDVVSITSNGRLTFGGGDTDYTETLSDLQNDWTVAGAWDDLNPSLSGVILWAEQDGALTVRYERIREVNASAAQVNSFTIVLMESGRILIEYDAMALSDAIVGWACVPLYPSAETNLSTTMSTLSSSRWGIGDMTEWSIYEQFTAADPLDLDNSVLRFCGNVDDVTDTCAQ